RKSTGFVSNLTRYTAGFLIQKSITRFMQVLYVANLNHDALVQLHLQIYHQYFYYGVGHIPTRLLSTCIPRQPPNLGTMRAF
ncbi:hypothetical protein, partial [Kiloniella litopenaei]|uniref:hypothetical protein n=1 Tax=Kiloniella litopenaei TaxID=1549748 RepID=UPI0019515432